MNKILLVDDDRELTSLLKELLEMEGFNVIVTDGEQALDLLDDSIDLLLLDVMMPKKKWYRHIKSRQTHQTPVIMLTARGSELIAFSALSWAQMTIQNRLMIVSWWHVFARSCAVRALGEQQQKNNDNGSPTLEVDALSLNPGHGKPPSTGKHWS